MTEPTHELKHLFRKPPEDFFFWLESQGVDTETRKLFEQHMIDGFTFSMLTMNDLREMGVVKIGILKKLVFLIDVWRSRHQSCCFCLGLLSDHDLDCSHCCESYQSSAVSSACELHPKIWKVIISAIYAFLSLGVTSFVMVLAHERLPDISKYPPLPDILLDNLPYIPWAFEAAEIIAVCLCLIWFTVLFFHKHRLILFRRFCSLLGTVFLLRSVTMIITSLSVPGKHLLTECRPFVFDSYGERLARAAEIWFGMGRRFHFTIDCQRD
ncbi:unnamed protein product [Hydatigera taeniaeformis]|uniref:SAM domain-containing protein n=1 Tax=Hydatigena taeniaeformis TaxID=6205 RepID=A0A0R3WVC8_HYDTA|nr:unnamed protein product [Hydatigera taeniaeformis]